MKKNKQKSKGYIYKGPEYSLMIKYSPKASREKLIKVIPKKGQPFEIKTESLVELISKHVNFETLAPAFIHNKKIEMIRVNRVITFTPNRDIKAGETVNIPFQHMMPIEFAIAEEALGVARIDDNVKTINASVMKEATNRVNQSVQEYVMEQYRGLIKSNENSNPNSS